MNRTAPAHTNQPSVRSGFSLLELLAVIVVISILVSLLLPAINSVRRTAANAVLGTELTNLDVAITNFSSSSGGLGVQPWSEIVLTEDPTVTSWTPDSQTKLRRMFEEMDFARLHDFNGDGDKTDVLTLTGSECLVFFLGGVLSSKDTNNDNTVDATEAQVPQALLGFSKNPLDPFETTGSSRVNPFHNFATDRLRDLDGDGMFEYVDNVQGQQVPIHFASSNNGQGYSALVSIYVQADGRTPWNRDAHQLISPGADQTLGFEPIPAVPPGLRMIYAPGMSFGSRAAESDNIANFKPGTTLGD